MTDNDKDKQIIERYQQDEKMMILVYAQWCINHDLDPNAIYKRAYPDQIHNELLEDVLEQTVSKQESEDIPDQTVIQALQAFGNDDLAFAVQEQIDRFKRGEGRWNGT
ncbi:hypothetical protein GCM10008983_04970 [Lentibacillus halophilus]|uniref:Phage protein n=1 Tax=Lentibacillus halophilus TaxID=295065 RepID=A0ABP3IX75_9BACI